jgi:hypothetical protein
MANMIERPAFYEGQILAGADLNATVDHARGQAARHERYLHIWGVAEGLDLKGEDQKTAGGDAYKEISVGAGMAVDASGREVVLAGAMLLPDQAFDQSNVWVGQPDSKDVWYPVFLSGRDAAVSAAATSVGRCASSEPSRLREEIQFDFGRPGDETGAAEDDAAAVGAGPDTGLTEPRRVLLGFVAWSQAISKFVDCKASHNGVGRRYAGVRADTIAARGGSLAMRTRSAVAKGKPALELNESDNGMLAFGPLTAAGAVEPVFSVNAKGDLTIAGKFTGAVTPGTVQVQSGVAMDGMLLPLPPGVDQELLDQGKATAHVHVTARVPSSLPPDSTSDWAACPLECTVDATRRLRCTVRWIAAGVGPVDLPGACDYMVVVSVAAA